MSRRSVFEEMVGAGDVTRPDVNMLSNDGESPGHSTPKEASGDMYVMFFAGETWNIIMAQARKLKMSPEAFVSRAIMELVAHNQDEVKSIAHARSRPVKKSVTKLK